MSECFPPVALYIVTAIIVTMFAAVMAKIERGDSFAVGEIHLAAFLLFWLVFPFVQLSLITWTTVFTETCGSGSQLNRDALWLLAFHGLTILPLPFGMVWWFWCRIRRREAM